MCGEQQPGKLHVLLLWEFANSWCRLALIPVFRVISERGQTQCLFLALFPPFAFRKTGNACCEILMFTMFLGANGLC